LKTRSNLLPFKAENSTDIMNNIFIKARNTFNDLEKKEKVAVAIIASLFIALFFFVSGISVGEALFKVTH